MSIKTTVGKLLLSASKGYWLDYSATVTNPERSTFPSSRTLGFRRVSAWRHIIWPAAPDNVSSSLSLPGVAYKRQNYIELRLHHEIKKALKASEDPRLSRISRSVFLRLLGTFPGSVHIALGYLAFHCTAGTFFTRYKIVIGPQANIEHSCQHVAFGRSSCSITSLLFLGIRTRASIPSLAIKNSRFLSKILQVTTWKRYR